MGIDWFKFILFGFAVAGSLFLGFWPGGLTKAKPAWWRWLAIVSLLALAVLSFGTPTAGTFGGMSMVQVSRGEDATVSIRGTVLESANGSAVLEDASGKVGTLDLSELDEGERADFVQGADIVVALRANGEGNYDARYVIATDPIVCLPLIPALEERARNIFFHVPVAWVAQLAWIIATVFAIMYQRKGKFEYDTIASSAAAVGALFALLATVTGSLWAKFNWGSFWNWDPRQVSIFIVLIIYGAYFALRSAISSAEQRARISSIYIELLLLPLTYFIFVYPRTRPGLHPGAEGDGTMGPVIDPAKLWLDTVKQVYFALGFFAMTLLYFWLTNLSVRSRLLELRQKRRQVSESVTEGEGIGISAIEHTQVRQS